MILGWFHGWSRWKPGKWEGPGLTLRVASRDGWNKVDILGRKLRESARIGIGWDITRSPPGDVDACIYFFRLIYIDLARLFSSLSPVDYLERICISLPSLKPWNQLTRATSISYPDWRPSLTALRQSISAPPNPGYNRLVATPIQGKYSRRRCTCKTGWWRGRGRRGRSGGGVWGCGMKYPSDQRRSRWRRLARSRRWRSRPRNWGWGSGWRRCCRESRSPRWRSSRMFGRPLAIIEWYAIDFNFTGTTSAITRWNIWELFTTLTA